MSAGKRDLNLKAKLPTNDLGRRIEVGVVGDDQGLLEVSVESVEKEMRGKIDVRTLLLGLVDQYATVRGTTRGLSFCVTLNKPKCNVTP